MTIYQVNKKNIKKIDIAKNINKQTGFSVQYSKKLVDDLIKLLINNIKNGHLVLKNLGSFSLIKKKSRLGRNPKTKEEFIINSRLSISFKSSKTMRDDLNNLNG